MNLNYPSNPRVCLKDKQIYFLPFHERLKRDPELQHSFKCNIAMAFIDNVHQYKEKTGAQFLSKHDIHLIANNAAEHFINLWISD
jgi:hypothetical protein